VNVAAPRHAADLHGLRAARACTYPMTESWSPSDGDPETGWRGSHGGLCLPSFLFEQGATLGSM